MGTNITKNNQGTRRIKGIWVLLFFYTVLLTIAIVVATVIGEKRQEKYYLAKEVLDDGRLIEAKELFQDLGNYKDSKELLEEIDNQIRISIETEKKYLLAKQYINDGNYYDAVILLESNIDYKDSRELLTEARYLLAIDYFGNEEYQKAKDLFMKTQPYGDSLKYLDKIYVRIGEDSKAKLYDEAVKEYKSGDFESARTDFLVLGNYRNSLDYVQKCNDILRRLDLKQTLFAGICNCGALRPDTGSVIAVGDNSINQIDVEEWKDINSIDNYHVLTIGLLDDGTVKVAGRYDFDFDETGGEYVNTDGWNDIVDVAAGQQFVLALRKDGTVLFGGHKDGKIEEVKNWDNITAIDAGYDFAVGLAKDKTLKFSGKVQKLSQEYNQNTDKWKNVVNISCSGGSNDPKHGGYGHIVGLNSDGTVVAIGDNSFGQCDVTEWKDIIKVRTGDWYTVGLKKDGGILITGNNSPHSKYIDHEKLDMCKNIIDIAAGFGETICVDADGNLTAFGFDESGWANLPDNIFR